MWSQSAVTRGEHAQAGATASFPSEHAEGGTNGSDGLPFPCPASFREAPPEALRCAILRADPAERRAIASLVSWLTHTLAQDARRREGCCSVERRCVRADATRGDLPFDKAALTRVWNTRHLHLLHGARAADIARDMVKWCSPSRDGNARAPQWHWLPSVDAVAFDAAALADLPLREWPSDILSTALTLANLRDGVLPDLSLPNSDLRGIHAPGAQFCGGQFDGTIWSGARLRRAGFAYANQVNADFERADLREACFRAAVLSGARVVGADLRGAEFLHTVMNGADLSATRCQRVTFEKMRLDDASFHRARMDGACFANGSACRVMLIGARARRSTWTSVTMSDGRACGADLRDAAFRQCDLAGWDARGSQLNGVFFEACDMRRARFYGASLKRVRIGRDCDLSATQWQDARLRLDGAWLRQLTPSELEPVVQSWMTFPMDQPAMRADVFLQLLNALSHRSAFSAVTDFSSEMAPPLHRLPEHVQRSDWLGRLLAAPGGAGGLADHECFARLRAQWLARKLDALNDVRLTRDEASWATDALMVTLHRLCLTASPEAVWAHAGAICQTLYWAEEGLGGVSDSRTAALRAAWFNTLPAQVHVALSADGINALAPAYLVWIQADGKVAARLPKSLTAGVWGAASASQPKEGAVGFAGHPLPGWHWAGTRVVVRDLVSPEDYVAGTMRELQGLLRQFGCLASLWPVDRPLEAFVRLTGRWLGEAGEVRASAASRGGWPPSVSPLPIGGDALPMVVLRSQRAELGSARLSPAERLDATVYTSRSPAHVRLQPAGRADIDEVFRDHPLSTSATDATSGLSPSRRVRLISVTAGLAWLATQPEWYLSLSSIDVDQSSADGARLACRRYALAALNETMIGEAVWRVLPQAIALRACLSDDTVASRHLAERLTQWLTCPEIMALPGLADACRQTLPWFWAIRFPLPAHVITEAIRASASPRQGSDSVAVD
ncbi:pentapeptide repeat-containing protein [Pandoraea sputorum]|uniref:pentapeptide repeat-containing protein n=1 Tax=Pandoraea sputorum TaxID=93222 RepID=UPI001E53AB24|nr:pentapeptide repeat-containing protein [Pandoraea sputorum]MCE4059145.1 pentapeptide repeat-containing protein [Pandoraea sputorum]